MTGRKEKVRTVPLGAWVVANHHQRYRPGRVTGTATVTYNDATTRAWLYVWFGRFTLHLDPADVTLVEPPKASS